MQGEVTRLFLTVEGGRGPVIGPPNRSLPRGRWAAAPELEGGLPLDTSFLDTEQTTSGVPYRTVCIRLTYRLGCCTGPLAAGDVGARSPGVLTGWGRASGEAVGCGAAGGGAGYRAGLGARAAGAERRPWPAVWRRRAAARLPLGPFPRAAAWPERAGGAAACPARPFSHVFLGWPGDGLGFSLPLRPPAPSRAEGGGPWPGLACLVFLRTGVGSGFPHQPLAPSRAEGGGVGFGRGPAAPSTGRCPGRTGKGGPWARSCVAEGLRRQRQGDCLGCGRRGATPASSPLLLLLRPPSGPALPPAPAVQGPPIPRFGGLGFLSPFPFVPLRPLGPGRGGGGGRGLCRREEAPASPAPVPESGAGFGGPGCRAVGGAAFRGPRGRAAPARGRGLRARADNYRGDHRCCCCCCAAAVGAGPPTHSPVWRRGLGVARPCSRAARRCSSISRSRWLAGLVPSHPRGALGTAPRPLFSPPGREEAEPKSLCQPRLGHRGLRGERRRRAQFCVSRVFGAVGYAFSQGAGSPPL
ncbi:hypothetical protein C7M84_018108 [Penaeus vannamei]|uniref:Uncharacterized protein n=1 Tax=Penaeus vannamei TaxID=6689 RepID=A0A423SII8_PENVA|nr:hypothetical protein C7M84_018108 [Penaeus vannamei]